MGHNHGHHHHSHGHSVNNKNKKLLIWAVSLTLFFATIEIVYGFISGSLMIIGDGIHMSSDAISLFLSLIAVIIGAKAINSSKNFGYHRFEPIAAFVNGLTLILIPLYIIVEAISRFFNPVEINTNQMIVVGFIGLLINGIVGYILSKGESNLNMRSAMLHVMADMITSLSAVVVGILIYFTDILWLDPVGSLITSIIIIRGGYQIAKEALGILMEGVPPHLDYNQILLDLEKNGLVVEDLKIWCLNEKEIFAVMNVKKGSFLEIQNILHDNYGIEHENIYRK